MCRKGGATHEWFPGGLLAKKFYFPMRALSICQVDCSGLLNTLRKKTGSRSGLPVGVVRGVLVLVRN